MSAVPKLRFPEFETAYAFRYLGDEVAKISSGKTKAESDGKYELYGSTGVIGKTNSPECHGQNILIARVGANAGALNIVEGSYGVTDNTLILSAAETSCLNFIFYFLKSFNLNRLVFGSGQPLVTGGMIKKLKFSRPSLPEQQKIASFLSSVDKKIDLQRQKKDALELYKKGLMQKIFSQEIRFKQDDGSDFPDWEEVALGDVFEEIKDKVGDRKIPTYSISAGVGFVSQEEKFGKDISGRQNEKYIVLGVGDFSYNKGNSKTYNYGCIYPNDEGTAIAVPSVFISFRRKNASMSVGFFAKLFEGHYLDKGLRKLISSGARMDGLLNVNKKDFFALQVPYPHENEQKKIALFLSAIDVKIQNTSSQIEQMETFKKGLLQQMFV